MGGWKGHTQDFHPQGSEYKFCVLPQVKVGFTLFHMLTVKSDNR